MYTFNLFQEQETINEKISPTGVFFMLSDSLKLKAPSNIYFLGIAKNPWDHTKTVSFDTTPYITVWQHSHIGSPLFRVLCNVSSLDPINTKSVYLPQVFLIYSYIPDITAMIPFPWVSFICCLVSPAIILWTNKFWVHLTPPSPVPHFSVSVPILSHTFGYLPCASG